LRNPLSVVLTFQTD